MSVSIIQAQNLSILIKDQVLIQDINLEIPENSVLEIYGENNTGKSVLMQSFYGLHADFKGQLKVLEYNMNPIIANDKASMRRRVGFVPQTPNLLKNKTLRVNLSLALTAADRIHAEDPEESVQLILADFELDNKAKHSIESLSHSDQILLCIARAIIHRPKLLLIDSCLGQLDTRKRRLALEKIQKLKEKERTTVCICGLDSTMEDIMSERILFILKNKLLTQV
ncbi:MAG: ATP-binding cassette domain-containing protein [Bacteroidota bacterium]|nr:ATP-binding cassette domain-containing protein [Bacteroidota bacterium]